MVGKAGNSVHLIFVSSVQGSDPRIDDVVDGAGARGNGTRDASVGKALNQWGTPQERYCRPSSANCRGEESGRKKVVGVEKWRPLPTA